MRPSSRLLFAVSLVVGAATAAQAQTPPKPHPWGRVSFYVNGSHTSVDGVPGTGYGEFITSIAYQVPDQERSGLDYGLDARHSGVSGLTRPQRLSVYEGYVGARLMGGALRVRGGHLWLSDLGALGSVAGAAVEVRQKSNSPTIQPGIGRLRVGFFGGLEPSIAEWGYAQDVKKFGGYVALDGAHARRHVLGFVNVRDASMSERSVLTATNFVPMGRKFFLYQAAEYDVQRPAGQAQAGLTYFMANARVSPTTRLDLQGTYNRGRSVDTRGLAQDILSGRPVTQTTVDGLLYESVGGRATVEVVRRVRVYAGYTRDKTNREDTPTGRTLIGGHAGNLLGSGFDVSASDAFIDGANRQYQSRFLSAARQIGRTIYVSGDYSTSLSVLHFSRSDGVVIEMRPRTRRVSGNATIYLNRKVSLLFTIERTRDDQATDVRMLSGMTYRFQ